jgi:hypothetical protein
MCKKAMSVIVLLFSGVWAHAQTAQPGYSVLTTDQGSARFGNSLGAGPPEPAPLGASGGAPMVGSPGAMGYPQAPGYPAGPGMMGGGMGPMGGPGMGPMAPMGGPGMGPMGGPGMMGGPPIYSGPGMGGPDPSVLGPMMPGGPVGPSNSYGSETVWFSLDYLASWLQKPHLTAPLLTVGSPNDNFPGALQQPGTSILFGDGNYNFRTFSGMQASVGVNLNDHWYLELDGFVLPTQSIGATYGSDGNGNPLIARPVVANGQNLVYFSSFPGVISGSTAIAADTQLWGIEAVARYKFEITPYLTGDFLLGFRQMQLQESLQINDTLTPIVPSVNFLGNQIAPGQGTFFTDFDRFSTVNTFYGVDFGGRLRWQSGYDWFGLTGYWKEALGTTYQNVNISGATSLVTPAGTTTVPGGILAQQSNIGSYNRTTFGSITEGGVGFIFTPCKYVRFELGYSAMYWNSVARPGNQINANVTPTQVPTNNVYTGPAPGNLPAFVFRTQGMTVQSFNLGLTLYY